MLKDADWIGKENMPQADHRNMVYAGSMIVRGRSQGVVVATGNHSLIGRLALDVISGRGGKPPLIERMERFTRWIAIAVMSAALAVAFVGVIFGGYTIKDMFLFGVALAVSAVPEGLPVALTVGARHRCYPNGAARRDRTPARRCRRTWQLHADSK